MVAALRSGVGFDGVKWVLVLPEMIDHNSIIDHDKWPNSIISIAHLFLEPFCWYPFEYKGNLLTDTGTTSAASPRDHGV